MRTEERTSLVRVLVDLIKADNVIDEGEMELYVKLKDDYSITHEDEIAASTMTLADAVFSLSKSPCVQDKELRLAGFHFDYIPHKANPFASTVLNISKMSKKLYGKLHNVEDYMLSKNSYNSYKIGVPLNMVYVINRNESKELIPTQNSKVFSHLYSK